jgi:hypothetical protein
MMIYLGGESTIHNGIMVLPDYGNPRQFYYLPPPPRLAVDRQSGQKVFKLIKLVGGLTDPIDGDGTRRTGIAVFDFDLALTDQELAELEDHVRQEFGSGVGGLGEINLAPLFYKDGAVVCYILGEQDWPDDAPSEPTRSNIFVEQLRGFGKPSLYGDNRASLSARMTAEGATVLESSLAAGGALGISIVYTLKFDALQPAFKFKVVAKWEQIYHYLRETYGVDLWFFSDEKTNIVEELEHNQLLQFEEVLFDPAASGDVQQLRKQLQQYILEKFFTPVLAAGDPLHNRIPGIVHDVLRAAVVVPSFGYQRRELTQEERRSFSFEATRISAVERVIYPQANLFALIPPAEVPAYIQSVNTDSDLFFRQVNVDCVLGGFDFAKSKIAWVHPYVRYGDAPQESIDKTLTAMSDRMTFTTWLQPNHGFAYRAGYEVGFVAPQDDDPDAIFGQQLQLQSGEDVHTDRVLPINPLDLFTLRHLEFTLKQGFPIERYAQVLIEVKHEDSTGYQVEKAMSLTGEKRSGHFRVRMPQGVTGSTQYRLTYYPIQGETVGKGWQAADSAVEVIDDPFPSTFSVRVGIAENPADVAWADVVLAYEDIAQPGQVQEERLFFAEEDLTNSQRRTREWVVRTSEPAHQRFRYWFTIVYKDNSQLETPFWIESDARTLVIGRLARMWRTVGLTLAGPSFDQEQLRDVTVTLWHDEGEGPETVQRAGLALARPDQAHEFTYQVQDPTKVGYEYEVLYRWRNGRTHTVKGSSPAGALSLHIPTRVS